MEQFLASRGLLHALTPRGAQLVGACPLHGGDNPTAFVVHRRRGLWRCFTGPCGGGDIVELVRKLDGCSYAQAAHTLALLARSAPAAAAPPPRPACLVQHRVFRPYTRRLRLDPHHPFLASRGVWPHTAERWEVGAWHGTGMLAGCIGVRLHDPGGAPLGYAGRRLTPQGRGKWVLPPNMPRSHLLYGLHRLPHTRRLVLVEGPWDVLRLAQLTIPAVALLGSSLAPQQEHLLRAWPELIILLDDDPAGCKGTEQILERFPSARAISVGGGRDPADLSDRELRSLLLF